MPGLQSLLASFVTTNNGNARNGETVFQHPHTETRIALAADGESIQGLASFGWTVSKSAAAASFSVLPALQRIFPSLQSQHPDQLAKLLTFITVAQLIEAQPEDHRGRMVRWLLGRSRSTGNAELAKWTRDACAELPIRADHPLAPSPDQPTYLQGPDTVARITGSELTGYKLLLVTNSNGRTMLSSAPTLDDLWTPNSEWTTAQWHAYEQLLRATPCDAPAFTAHVDAPHADAASHTQHLWAIEQGTAAYLGSATDDLRRRFRHTPSSQWLDSASAETGISLQSASGMNRLIDLFMVEHLDESAVLQHIVPAMREADSDFAELSDTALAAIWRSAYNPILNSVLRAADDKVRFRVGEAPPAAKSSVATMRSLLSSYYGEGPIATLELAGKLHLVESVDDLPPNLRDEVDLHGGRDRVSGMEAEKKVYLIGANTAPENVCSVFLHEVGEHAALHTMLGRDYGRIVQRFNELLAEGDTYALQASMMVPSTTAPSNLNSEHLAHLIQLSADDLVAKDGGVDGFDLGQRCIRDLRTWLYRTPLMRELERQGELEDFKLDAHDIATLAREAVDFYVADHQHSTTSQNQWDSKLDGEFVAALHKMSVEQRIQTLQPLPVDQQLAYLYALGTMHAPHGYETLTKMAAVIAEATNSPDEVSRLIANEVSALTLRLATQSRASRRLDAHGFFAAISDTHDPVSSVLTLIRAAEQGQWVAEHYQAGLGLTLREEFESIEEAVQILGQHHFSVQQNELDSVIARWGSAVAAEHRQLDSQAFQRWFGGSVTRYTDGSPMVMYHGTAKSFSQANGIFWASAPTPTKLRPEPAPAAEPAPTAQSQFDRWFAESKIVTADGKPLTLYHGTNANFNAFKVSKFGAIGAGVYTTPNAGEAQIYGDRLIGLHASLANPLIGTFAEIRAMQYTNETSEQFTERLIGLGYDGVATKDATGSFDYVVAFDPSQLKSVSQNNGMYDRTNQDIRFRAEAPLRTPTETLAFQNWFAGSAIKDADGQPLVVYHGTGDDFTAFKAGPSYFSPRLDYSYVRNSDVVMPVYLNIQNPYRPANQQEIETIRSNPERYEELKAQGYDGMIWSMPDNIMKGASGWGDDLPQIVAFYPSQVKSAIGNAGTFDRASDDIRFDMPGIAPQIEQSAFSAWFGKSQLVNAAGAPLVLYHGTNKDFTEFDSTAVNSRFPFSFGFHFTDSRYEASIYADSVANGMVNFNPASRFGKPPMDGGNVMLVYLKAENPLFIHTDHITASLEADVNREQILAKLEEAKVAGTPYDSVIIKRERGDEYDNINVIVFDPRQIKSATGNVGSFDRDSADIRLKLNGQLSQTSLPTFKDWFVRSKVVDEDGAPLVVYHGSHQDFSVFQQQEGAHLGFHFGNQQAANTRLDDKAEKYFDNAEYIRLNERASMFYMDLRAFNKSLEEKSANTSPETILADAKRLGKQVWEIIGDYAYQPTPEELSKRNELETRFKEANVLVHKYGTGSHINAFYLSIQRPLRLTDVGDWGTPDTVARELPWGSDANTFEEIVAEIKAYGFDGIVYHNKVENMAGEQADSFIAFDPEQIKSAIGNVGTFDRESADVRFAYGGAGAQTASRQLMAGAKLRFAYSDDSVRSQMDALADFYTKSDVYQFEQYEERERIIDHLIEQLAGNELLLGIVLPVAFGFSTLTQSAKQPGAWQVTALDANFVPLSDEGTQSKREALATFFAQFDTASAAAVITGTTADIQIADTHPGLSKSLKGSTLADEYAEMRQDVASYTQSELEADRALVMPVYLSAKTPFDGDKLPTGSMRVGELRDELVRQAEAAGRHIDVMLIGSLVKTITKAARAEESGPYYVRHDFWANRASLFGGAGAAALEQLFTHCGFDSIKLTERDHLTYGVFSPAQVKSASGNSGLFSANPDIRFSFAGANALTSNVSRLKQAKQLAEQQEPADSIWHQTGWMVGTDGEWRFEIDDSKARVRGFNFDTNEPEVTTTDPERYLDWVDESMHSRDGVPLGQFYDHPELFAAYPQLAHLKVVAVERGRGDTNYGSFAFYSSFAKSKLFVAAPYTLSIDGPTLEEVLSHETQHAIQHLEGFGPGAISSDFDGDLSTNENLKSNMRAYVEIHDQSASIGCEPEKFAELSGHEPLVIERISTWRQQGNWETNVASFRRNLMSPYDLYFHEAGEVEARNTAHRLGMDAEQRANTFPLDTIDVESSLVRVTRKIRVFADSRTGPETTAFSRADSAFEWATKTHSWRTGLNDNAQLIHTGDSINLFSVLPEVASREGFGEVFAVTLDDTVVGSFLYGPAGAGQLLNAAAMVHPDFRRQGIASAAYDSIERVTGLNLVPSATNASGSANAFWAARQASTAPDESVGDSDALSRWLRGSITVGADGKPTVFYHGSAATFQNFDAARHRSILNSNYQGDAFNFTPSAAVASKYATAARNQQFRQHDLFEVADKVLPPLASRLLKGLVEEGFPTWDKYSPQDMHQLLDTCLSAGFDLNDLVDLSQHVEGSASAWSQEDYSIFADHHNCDMPDDIKDLAVSLGLTDAVPTPIVMPVYLRCENTLFTDDRQQAREAQSKGYDSVCYSGEGTVDQEPEWMVFSSHNIRSVFEFEQDAKVFMQEHNRPMATPASAPITPPASTQFDHWFEGSSCINQFAEPRLVFVQDNTGHPFSTFTDLNAASADDKGRVTPAILAIRSPFVVTDSAHISITELNNKLGNRKAGLIVGELLRDGRVFIQDIIENPRYDKWLHQAGYDGVIYRNRDGENRYVTFTPTQALVGTAVAPDLTGTVQWGQIPSAAPLTFTGDRARARQFTLSNHSKPHGHVVPMSAADQYLGASDRLYVNHLGGTRLTAASITALCENPATSGQLRDFLTLNRKALAGKARIEDTFAEHIRTLRQDINQARQEARADTPQANHHRKMVDKLSNALAWAVEQSSSGKSFKGLVSEDLLQWNQPLSQQSTLVQRALSTLGIDGLYQVEENGIPQLKTCNRYTAADFAREFHDGKVVKLDGARLTGRACYEELVNDLGGSKQAAHLLASLGITGAQQSNAEVLLFKPEYNHEPLVAMAMCKSSPGALDGDNLAIHDIGGVLLKGAVHSACKSLWSNQERALEVAQSAINLLAARQAQQGEFASPLAANDVHNKQQLAEARALHQDLMFSSTPRQFLPWDQPPTEQQLKALAPVIQLDPAHALPGSAVFRLIAGRQEGIEGAKAMLSKAGFAGVTSEESTLAWGSGAEKVWRTVANDVPRQDFSALPVQAESARAMLTMSFG